MNPTVPASARGGCEVARVSHKVAQERVALEVDVVALGLAQVGDRVEVARRDGRLRGRLQHSERRPRASRDRQRGATILLLYHEHRRSVNMIILLRYVAISMS